MRRDRYKTSIAFIDLLFNITIGLAMLFIIAFLMINPITKKGDIEYKAEFMITLSWPTESYDDIDLYVKDQKYFTGNLSVGANYWFSDVFGITLMADFKNNYDDIRESLMYDEGGP